MGGPLDTIKQFVALESENPLQPIQNVQEAIRTTSKYDATTGMARPLTPPTEADRSARPVSSEFAQYGEEIVAAPAATQPIVASKEPPTPSAVAHSATTAADAVTIPTIADAEAGTLLSTLAPVSITATQGTSLKDSFAKSKILQNLAAGQEVAGDNTIATVADAEAGTALMEIVPETSNKERGDSVSSTSSA